MNNPQGPVAGPVYGQLRQERVPLPEADAAFARADANGRTPIIVTPQRLYRFVNGPIVGAVVALVIALFALFVLRSFWLFALCAVVTVALLVFGIIRWFYVQIPEGVNALLARGGRHARTIGSGLHFLLPFVAITHLVTRREIPFDVPVAEASTRDSVRADVDALVTFTITEPADFVYRISAADFDQVFQACCQEAVRALVRDIPSDQLSDLVRHDTTDLCAQIHATISSYGVTVSKIIIVYAQPPADFIAPQEAKQLAILQRAEQEEKQALAERRQADADALTRQQLLARVEREQAALEAQLRQIAARQEIVTREAAVEAERLARLEERLRAYPLAAQAERERARTEIARAFAGNTRAILHVGHADDIARALVMREAMQDTPAVAPEGARLTRPQDGIAAAPAPIGQNSATTPDAVPQTSDQPAADD